MDFTSGVTVPRTSHPLPFPRCSPLPAERLRFDLFALSVSVRRSGALPGGWAQGRSKVGPGFGGWAALPAWDARGLRDTRHGGGLASITGSAA